MGLHQDDDFTQTAAAYSWAIVADYELFPFSNADDDFTQKTKFSRQIDAADYELFPMQTTILPSRLHFRG